MRLVSGLSVSHLETLIGARNGTDFQEFIHLIKWFLLLLLLADAKSRSLARMSLASKFRNYFTINALSTVFLGQNADLCGKLVINSV